MINLDDVWIRFCFEGWKYINYIDIYIEGKKFRVNFITSKLCRLRVVFRESIPDPVFSWRTDLDLDPEPRFFFKYGSASIYPDPHSYGIIDNYWLEIIMDYGNFSLCGTNIHRKLMWNNQYKKTTLFATTVKLK